MNRQEFELAKLDLKGEREVLEEMRRHFSVALDRVNARIEALADRSDLPGIRQRRFQEMLAEQIGGIMDDLGSGCYATLEEYLTRCYEDGFVGTLYDLQKQGIPLAFPLDQDAVARSVTTTADGVKLSKRMYGNVAKLQSQVIAEVTRGFADASHVTKTAEKMAVQTDIAGEIKRNVKGRGDQALRRSMTIARTEKGRVRSESSLAAMHKAKDAGADVVKQWDSTLDSRTRDDHRKLDGQIRELDEPFEVGGHKGMAPHKFGRPEQDINCRCVILQRSRTALEVEDKATKWDGVSQCYVDLSDARNFTEFKSRYEKLVSGAASVMGALNDSNDPDGAKRDAHADLYYEEVRNRDKAIEVAAIATNSGIPESDVAKAYDHLFVNEYDLYKGHSRFDPMYEIAESWRRLREGKDVKPHDLTLLRHEAYEYDLMQGGMSYDEAHAETEKLYNYSRELRDFTEE